MKRALFVLSLLVSHVICQYAFTCNITEDCLLTSSGVGGATPEIVPDPTNCENFYMCNADNEPGDFSYACGENFHFNGELAENPGCVEGACPQATPICTGRPKSECYTSCGEGGSDTRIAFPGNCASSYLCTDFGIFEAACDDGSQSFNGTGCDDDHSFACCNTLCGIPSCTEATEKMSLPDRYGCQNFYMCLNGVPLLQTCPDGEGFDIETNACKVDATCGVFCSQEAQ